MIDEFDRTSVSIVLTITDRASYDRPAFADCLAAALDQDHPSTEIIVVDGRGPDAEPDYGPATAAQARSMRHLPGHYANRAAMYNTALQAASGQYLLAVFNDRGPVRLRRSAVRTMVMAAGRQEQTGLVYADYELIDATGQARDVHLLDWHPGRLRDAADFGQAILFSTPALKELGGFNEKFAAADLYDLRLRVTEKYGVKHIANRFAGSLYTVTASAKAHDVFDYLLADKNTQLETETALTEHLRRTGAYLTPGAHFRPIEYTAAEQERFADCMASVVIPVNRRPEFIGRAIESVQAQTVRHVEVIVVVNGGPDDPTIAAVERYLEGGPAHNAEAPPVRLIVVDINNLGLCLNTGISAAAGKYYVQLDSDDRLKPDAVEKLLAVFDSDPAVGMVIGSYEVWNLDKKSGQLSRNENVPVVTHDEWTADNGRNNLLRIGGAGAPRSAHIKVIQDAGWFGVNDDPACRNYAEDYDLVMRISERYAIGRVWDPIYEVIRHSGGTDHSIDQVTIDRNDEAKDHMRLQALRRRQALNAKSGD
ncbi:MAG: glycosyltransferase [bacterium]|nr:glycosyltransferase [bacterium]